MEITKKINEIVELRNNQVYSNEDFSKEISYLVDSVQKEMIDRFNKLKLQDVFVIELAREIK